jgi:hypothetical protein
MKNPIAATTRRTKAVAPAMMPPSWAAERLD